MEFEHKISIIGSTGSIGTQTLEIARAYPGIQIEAISGYSNVRLLEEQAREFRPKTVCVGMEEVAKDLRIRLADLPIRVLCKKDGLIETAVAPEAKTIVTAVVGIAGLEPTLAAIRAGKNIALANKETLVTGGHLVTRAAKENGCALLPVDSEHSAIFQSLQGCQNHGEIEKILLTASGGPFFGKTKEELQDITPEAALKHPNWTMGAKVTIDSSTLVNKGLETIEAKWLFDVEMDQIQVLVHRQSVVHSMVEFRDHAVIAQLGVPDMRLPIQYALTYPERLPMQGNELDFRKFSELTFAEPDLDTFYALRLAYRAGREGGILPCIFNAADEAAVDLFLKRKIRYPEISELIADAMDSADRIKEPNLTEILEADRAVKESIYAKYRS